MSEYEYTVGLALEMVADDIASALKQKSDDTITAWELGNLIVNALDQQAKSFKSSGE